MKPLTLLLAGLLGSCAYLPRAARTPVPVVAAGPAVSSEMVVFLPGRRSLPQDYRKKGFFKIATERWPGARLVGPDLHMTYYRDRSAVLRLHDDVIAPARRQGVKKIHLVGISLGGMGAALYDATYPGEITDMILLSPYLGEPEAIVEIEQAGGLKSWHPAAIAADDFSRQLWQLLKSQRDQRSRVPVTLGCGNQDRLSSASRLYAREFLPAQQVHWIDGVHDWPTWQKLFAGITAHARKW